MKLSELNNFIIEIIKKVNSHEKEIISYEKVTNMKYSELELLLHKN